MQNYDGILVAVTNSAISITGNTIEIATGHSGRTPIRIEAASHVVVQDNTVTRPMSEGRCIFIYANGAHASDVAVVANTCNGGNYNQIDFDGAPRGDLSRITCSGNTCSGAGTGTSASCISIAETTGAVIFGNQCHASAAAALSIRSARMLNVHGNLFNSQGPTSVLAIGDCAGSVYAADNVQNGAIVDLAVGLLVL
jgi:hypothetical protein